MHGWMDVIAIVIKITLDYVTICFLVNKNIRIVVDEVFFRIFSL